MNRVRRRPARAAVRPRDPTGPRSESGHRQGIRGQPGKLERDRTELVGTSRYFFTHSRNSTLDRSSSNWDLSLFTMGLLSEPLKSRQGLVNHAAAPRALHVYEQRHSAAANLCVFSPGESASGRNFWFSSDSLFQLSAAAAAPDQRKSQKIKRP